MSSNPDPNNPSSTSGDPSVVPPTLTVATAATATTNSTFKPPTPKMGGLIQVTATDWCAWTGGVPLADWSGLDPTAPTTPTEDYQFRHHNPAYSQKATKFRETGMENKFKRDDHLLDFISHVQAYFKRTGLDTISYLPDPTNSSQVASVLKEYSKFDLNDTLSTACTLRSTQFDRVDCNNDDSAKHWLLDSIDPGLKKDIEDRVQPTDGFAIHWLQLIHLVESTSYSRFDDVKKEIEHQLTLLQFPGQNVQSLAVKIYVL